MPTACKANIQMNIKLHITGPLWGESGGFPSQRVSNAGINLCNIHIIALPWYICSSYGTLNHLQVFTLIFSNKKQKLKLPDRFSCLTITCRHEQPRGPRLTLIPTWISNYIQHKVWDKITYPLSNFNGTIVEVWEWICNFIAHFTRHMIIYPCWD